MTNFEPAVEADDNFVVGPPSVGTLRWRREISTALATVALTLIALTLTLQLWRARPEVPFAAEGDAAFYAMTIQNVIDSGWHESAARLGAPFGTSLHDFPQSGDNLQFLMIRGLVAVSSDVGVVMNAYFLLTFVIVALSALLVLRWIGVSGAVAAVLAVLYAFLPYHFWRNEAHLFLSGYYAVPLGIALAVMATRGDALFGRRPGARGPAAFATRRSITTLALAAVIGSSGSYYAAFTVVLLGSAGGLHALRGRSLRGALPAMLAAAAIVGVLGFNLLPDAVHTLRHGANGEVAQRTPTESDRFGLKLSSMLLPEPGHRIAALSTLGERYRAESDVPSEGGQSLGMVGALGLLWLLAAALTRTAGGRPLPGERPAHRTLAFLTVASLLTGTIGGFSVLVAYLLTPQFRSWNRFSVFIGFLALAAVGLLVDNWWARRAAPGSALGPGATLRRPAAGAGLALLLVVGLLDQTTAGAVPPYAANAARHDSDRAFVAAIERRLPSGAMVYQLPFVSFPEAASVAGTDGYEQFRGYLHSSHLRWSSGGMRGRDHGWQQELATQPVDLFLARLVAIGFAGLWIDRAGYSDRGHALEESLARRLAAPPLLSGDDRFSFFSLVDYADTMRRFHPEPEMRMLAAQTLAPVRVHWGDGAQAHREDGDSSWIDLESSALLELENPGTARRIAEFDARIEAPGPGGLTITWPDRSVETLAVIAGETPFHRRVVVPGGRSTVRFRAETAAFPARVAKVDVRFRLLQPSFYDDPPDGFG